MKFSIAQTMAATCAILSSVALGAPAADASLMKRDGPSGQIYFPTYNVNVRDGLSFQYKPVEQIAGGSGQVTKSVIVNLVQDRTIVPLGSAPFVFPNYYNGPNTLSWPMSSQTRQGFKCGDWAVQVTEEQEGSIYTGTFLAAAPTVTFAGC
ncbi:hypothetical protein EMMF5_003367 [Cystobasidiomycetes sp. EMM_F5]